MTAKYILVFLLSLVGSRDFDGAWRYARAIAAATADTELQAAAAVVVWRENHGHESSYPPFGLMTYVATHRGVCLHREGSLLRDRRGCVPLSIEEGAQRSVAALRFIRDRRCPSRQWVDVFGRYGPTGRCEITSWGTNQVIAMSRAQREWAGQ
jgi:hypothetical protein